MAAAEATEERRWAREYETIYILRPNVDPDEADKVAQRLAEVVARLDGKLTKVDNWGKRKLAYNIAKFSRGIFVYVRYVGFGDLVGELERNLRMLDPVMRFQTVKLRDMVDPQAVEVDPDEVKFLRVETTEEEEEEPNLEQRLGMSPRREARSEEEAEESGEEEE